MTRAIIVALLFCSAIAWPEKYTGPRPEKPDLPYLVHADNLVATEQAEAKEEHEKNDITYVISGPNSPAKTPLAGPIFLFQAEKFTPESLEVYRLEVKNGRRQITFRNKKKGNVRPFHLYTTRLEDNLYRIEVVDSLENGEYCLTPRDSNQVFCFEVY